MVIRLHINSDGSVANGAVRTSTSPNPALDAKVVSAMQIWKFPATSSGDVDVDYPIVFAHSSDEEARLESDLQTKVASLSSSESAEYTAATAPVPEASPPAGAPGAEAAGVASPSAGSPVGSAPSPEAAPSAAVAPPVTPEVAKPHHKHKPRRRLDAFGFR